jgi:hypothetical protein
MGPGLNVIANMGCADGGTACTPISTLPTRYESEAACAAASVAALENGDRFDFPTILAQCQAAVPSRTADRERGRVTGGARSGS